jgi:hypothetical protein
MRPDLILSDLILDMYSRTGYIDTVMDP